MHIYIHTFLVLAIQPSPATYHIEPSGHDVATSRIDLSDVLEDPIFQVVNTPSQPAVPSEIWLVIMALIAIIFLLSYHIHSSVTFVNVSPLEEKRDAVTQYEAKYLKLANLSK